MRQTYGFSHRSSAKPTLKGGLAALFPADKIRTRTILAYLCRIFQCTLTLRLCQQILLRMSIFATEKPLTPSWQLLPVSFAFFKRNFWLLFVLAIAATIAATIDTPSVDELSSYQAETGGILGLLSFAGLAWGVLFAPALVYAQLQILRGESVTFGKAARQGFSFFWRLVGLYILTGLIVLGGLILLIVPGLIFIRRYCLAPYYLIDQNLSIRESLRRSAASTKPVSGFIWGVILVEIVIGIAGSILSTMTFVGLILGTIVTFFYCFALPLRYMELEHATVAKRAIKSASEPAV